MNITRIRHADDPLPTISDHGHRVFIGPANSAGQAGMWAEALNHNAVNITAIGYRSCLRDDLAEAHLRVDHDVARSTEWGAELRTYLVANFTHVLIESNTALWAGEDGQFTPSSVVAQAREAGISVAMIAHGSDVKIPSVYRNLRPETQYELLGSEILDRLERNALVNVAQFDEFAGPTFVTSPVLLRFLPTARWLPLVIDMNRWATESRPFEREVPVVVHSPSSVQKCSDWIDPAMQGLHDEGLIEYRRIEGIPHDKMPEIIRDSDIVIEQLGAGGYGVAACEAMAAGRVVVGTVDPLIRRHIASVTGLEVPIVRSTRESIADVVRKLIRDPQVARERAAAGPKYAQTVHDGRYAAEILRSWIEPRAGLASDIVPGGIDPKPACSVIVAVYNTAPYLEQTLASLERQTIGFEALQVILVDDGSTDGSERIVDKFGERHPANVEVVHQEASGTPASPFNRGLDGATGRYVFFLGSDDLLDDDALEILVNHADEWESDVIFGRMEPLGDRKVPIEIFKAGRVKDMDLYSSRLPYALANTKLFRRSLIENLSLRYREDMRQRCDQPFTITAMVNARRISMIGDGAVYHARERADRSNVTYTADAAEMYTSTQIIMETIADCLPPGPQRDHVMRRQFDNTIRGDLRDSHAHRNDEQRAFVFDRIAELSQRHLTDGILAGMQVLHRAILRAALDRDDDTLLALLELARDPEHRVGLHVDHDHSYFAYPGFDADSDQRSTWQIIRERPVARITRLFSPAEVQVKGTLIQMHGSVQITGTVNYEGRLVRDSAGPSKTVRSEDAPSRGREIDATIHPLAGTYSLSVDASTLATDRVFRPSIAIEVNGQWYDVPLRFDSSPQSLRRGLFRHTLGTARADEAGHLVIDRSGTN